MSGASAVQKYSLAMFFKIGAMFFKIGARPATLLKRDSYTGVFPQNLQNL